MSGGMGREWRTGHDRAIEALQWGNSQLPLGPSNITEPFLYPRPTTDDQRRGADDLRLVTDDCSSLPQ